MSVVTQVSTFLKINLKIVDLLTDSGDWDWNKMKSTFWQIDHAEVKRIPVGIAEGNDKLIGHGAPKGEYTVRSGYHLAISNVKSDNKRLVCGFNGVLKKL